MLRTRVCHSKHGHTRVSGSNRKWVKLPGVFKRFELMLFWKHPYKLRVQTHISYYTDCLLPLFNDTGYYL